MTVDCHPYFQFQAFWVVPPIEIRVCWGGNQVISQAVVNITIIMILAVIYQVLYWMPSTGLGNIQTQIPALTERQNIYSSQIADEESDAPNG